MITTDVINILINILVLVTWPLICPDCGDELTTTCEFDFIIVGGGSAGSVLAARLSENPNVKVLLLEAGGCQPLLTFVPTLSILTVNTNIDWKFVVQPQKNAFMSYPNNQPPYPQGKMLGGSSGINAMMYVRGNKLDYDNWQALGNEKWAYEYCLPYFLKAEGNTIPAQMADVQYHNTSGPLKVSYAPYSTLALETFLKTGPYTGEYITDYNAANQTGIAQIPFTMLNGHRWSTNTAYLQPVRNTRSNLVILTNAYVTKILTNSTKQAIGVEYQRYGLKFEAFSSKEVILSAGTFNSPKILMNSGIGPASHLQQHNIPIVKDLPGVGQNLQDHIGCWALFWKINCSKCTYSATDALSVPSVLEYLLTGNGVLRSIVTVGRQRRCWFFKSNYSSNKPDIQIQFASLNPGALLQDDLFSAFSGISPEVIKQYYGTFANESTFLTIVNNHNIQSRGTVTLQSNNPFDPPIIDLNTLSNPIDIKILIEAMKKAIALVNTPPFLALGATLVPTILPGCENIPQFSDPYFECLIRHLSVITYHPAGTCQMGPSNNSMAVVNANSEVYGVPGLRVIDASIMPVLITGNTNAPTIMMAEKQSDVIKGKYSI